MSRTRRAAGVLLYRRRDARLEVFLAHPGGPFYARKDDGVWSLPKGEVEADEPPLDCALREFAEETGQTLADCNADAPWSLGEVQQKGGKRVEAWACEGDWPADATLHSNSFELEWPPKSGVSQRFPEIDRVGFFTLEVAREKLLPAQAVFLDRLAAAIDPAATVYKLCPATHWDGAMVRPSDDDLRDGFIHLSTGDQLAGTLAKHFVGQTGLLKLSIDPSRVPTGALVWERSRGGARFPHLYAPLEAAAVTAVEPVEPPAAEPPDPA
jgi:predicted NUDIX family NTP pyrophosphohydrolase/uncharacterized protein (DUF952 family)